MDHSVGVILNVLREKGILENTIVIFSSDNGPVLNDGYLDNSEETANTLKYRPGGIYRGGKYSAFEAGTRVPFIVFWPSVIKSGRESRAMVCQIDLLASFAELLHVKLPENEWTDSRNYLSKLLGRSNISRDFIVEQSANSA